jgi:hypothetical protein
MSYIKFKGDPSYKRVNSAMAKLCDPVPAKKSLRLIDNCFSIVDKNVSQADLCDFGKLAYPTDSYVKQELEICQGENVVIFSNNLVGGTTATAATTINSSAVTLAVANNLIRVGSTVSGNGITAGTTVAAINGTALTLSAPATATGPNTVLTFVEVLNPNKAYVKGVIIYVNYPTLDEGGGEISPDQYMLTGSISSIFTNGGNSSSNFTIGQAYMYFAPEATTDPTKIINTLTLLNPSSTFSVKVSVLLIKTKTDVDPNNCDC